MVSTLLQKSPYSTHNPLIILLQKSSSSMSFLQSKIFSGSPTALWRILSLHHQFTSSLISYSDPIHLYRIRKTACFSSSMPCSCYEEMGSSTFLCFSPTLSRGCALARGTHTETQLWEIPCLLDILIVPSVFLLPPPPRSLWTYFPQGSAIERTWNTEIDM